MALNQPPIWPLKTQNSLIEITTLPNSIIQGSVFPDAPTMHVIPTMAPPAFIPFFNGIAAGFH